MLTKCPAVICNCNKSYKYVISDQHCPAWKCQQCGICGLSDDLDRFYLADKIKSILKVLYSSGLVDVLSLSMMEDLVSKVAAQCLLDDKYTHYHILSQIINVYNKRV